MIRYVTGDATRPRCRGDWIVAHVCNDLGAWGAGFVLAVSRRWPEPERRYRGLAARRALVLGEVDFVGVDDACGTVANMVAQRGVGGPGPNVDYDALALCLVSVAERARSSRATVHMPRIGCGLGGGSWDKIEPIIASCMRDAAVTVYDWPQRAPR